MSDLTRDQLAALYDFPADADRRAWVRTMFVATLDGAAADASGRSGSLGGDADTAVFHVARSLADVVLVGAGTARAESYGPATFDDDAAERRARHHRDEELPIAVVTRRLDVPDALMVPGTLVVTTADAPQRERDRLAERVDVVAHGEGQVHWRRVLADLAERGLRRVQCEGGPSLHGELVAADLVDELCLTVAPVLTGGDAPRIAHGGKAADRPMTLALCVPAGDVLLTRWLRAR
jgi:riboflavin biosynthesis pyrimidine reductase